MSAFDLDRLLPAIIPAKTADAIKWKGPLAHLGPVSANTPLKEALMGKTCCGLYLLYIGCVGLLSKRLVPVMNLRLNQCLAEQIYSYQFDWRYPSTYGITLSDIEANPDKIAAIRRTIPYFFFTAIKGTSGYFLSTAPVDELAFVVNLTRHLCGAENKAAVDDWVQGLLTRLDAVAPCDIYDTPDLQDYPTRDGWEAAVRKIHGVPLPLDLLDLAADPAAMDLPGLAATGLAGIDPTQNPLLRPADALRDMGLRAPYLAGA